MPVLPNCRLTSKRHPERTTATVPKTKFPDREKAAARTKSFCKSWTHKAEGEFHTEYAAHGIFAAVAWRAGRRTAHGNLQSAAKQRCVVVGARCEALGLQEVVTVTDASSSSSRAGRRSMAQINLEPTEFGTSRRPCRTKYSSYRLHAHLAGRVASRTHPSRSTHSAQGTHSPYCQCQPLLLSSPGVAASRCTAHTPSRSLVSQGVFGCCLPGSFDVKQRPQHWRSHDFIAGYSVYIKNFDTNMQ